MTSDDPDLSLPPSLDALITSLIEKETPKYPDILRSAKLPLCDLESITSWSPNCYTRNCIAENDDFELLLLCWEVGQTTPVHNHGGEECWVKVIKGELKETIYQVNDSGQLCEAKSSIAKSNDISYMIDFLGVHRLENVANQRSLSLHLYAKPIRNCEIFDEDRKCFVSKELEYNTVSPLVASV